MIPEKGSTTLGRSAGDAVRGQPGPVTFNLYKSPVGALEGQAILPAVGV